MNQIKCNTMLQLLNGLQNRYDGGKIVSLDDPKAMRLGFVVNGVDWLTVGVMNVRREEFYVGSNKTFAGSFKSVENRKNFAAEITECLAAVLKDKQYFKAKQKQDAERMEQEIKDALEMDDPGDRWEDLMI